MKNRLPNTLPLPAVAIAALGAAIVVVNIEGDPLTQEIQLGAGLAGEEVPRIDFTEAVLQWAAVGPHATIGGEHFIVKDPGIVALEQIHGLCLPRN